MYDQKKFCVETFENKAGIPLYALQRTQKEVQKYEIFMWRPSCFSRVKNKNNKILPIDNRLNTETDRKRNWL